MAQVCSNCGQTLTDTNIALALDDMGETDVEDTMTFFCPGYTDEHGCPGYGAEDRETMAYWYTRG